MSGRRGPPMERGSSRPYKVLCVSSLHQKASDDVVRDTLYREYKKYGDISVRVVMDPDGRVAYVYFRNLPPPMMILPPNVLTILQTFLVGLDEI